MLRSTPLLNLPRDSSSPSAPASVTGCPTVAAMKRMLATATLLCLIVVGCGGSDDAADVATTNDAASSSCLAGDTACADGADGGAAGELPDVISLADPDDPDAPLQVNFGGFFYSDGTISQLCSALAESFPPQCGSLVIDIEAPLDVVLEHVAESFGNPDDAKININQGIYWTDDWVNLSGTLQANRLVLE